MADYVIRRMEEKDVDQVGALWYRLSLHHEAFAKYYAVKPGSEAVMKQHVREVMQRNCIFFVCEIENTIIGFVSGYVVMRNPQLAVERVGKVDNIFVDDAHRGEGIGTKLLERLIQFLQGQGIGFIELSCDYANDRALKLYKRLGFKEQKVLLVREEE